MQLQNNARKIFIPRTLQNLRIMSELANTTFESCKLVLNRLSLDVGSALFAGLCVTPIIAPVDVSVTSLQSGKSTMSGAFIEQVKQIVFTPHKYVTSKPFMWIFTVYSLTYSANNIIDTVCKIMKINDLIPKLVGITAVNMYASILKDITFAKIFGTKPTSSVPKISLSLWVFRDLSAISAAFILPQKIAKIISNKNKSNISKAENQAQFLTPMLMQLVVLPFHLLGLDFYNVSNSKFSGRIKRIIKTYPKALPLRFYRMGGAFGFGGVNNKKSRNFLISKYEQRLLKH